jgi:LAO/AO transport system kinase
VIAVNKADEAHEQESERAGRELGAALRLLRGPADGWQPPVVACSGLHNRNLDTVWAHVRRHREWLERDGGLDRKRRDQLVSWTRALVRDRLLARLDEPALREIIGDAEDGVRARQLTPGQAATLIVRALDTG